MLGLWVCVWYVRVIDGGDLPSDEVFTPTAPNTGRTGSGKSSFFQALFRFDGQ